MLAILWITLVLVKTGDFNDAATTAVGPFGTIPAPVCGQIQLMMDNCFHNTTPRVVADTLYTVKIPENADDIASRCLLFNRGMDCVQHYLDSCVDQKDRKIVENEVYGARKLYEFLCRDKSFQREFLRHKTCFHHVHPDWDRCSKDFVTIMKEEMAKTNEQTYNVQYMHFCCARYGYEECVFKAAQYKCKPESAVFLQRIARLLSTDKHFQNCDKIEQQICSSGLRHATTGTGLLMMLMVVVLAGLPLTRLEHR
ncbi:uncharacterized protein LOC6042425 [Culex quinquefasciatus]|nr:uncharacterized protein LOC6042425 [Culex quinquefasciatus]